MTTFISVAVFDSVAIHFHEMVIIFQKTKVY